MDVGFGFGLGGAGVDVGFGFGLGGAGVGGGFGFGLGGEGVGEGVGGGFGFGLGGEGVGGAAGGFGEFEVVHHWRPHDERANFVGFSANRRHSGHIHRYGLLLDLLQWSNETHLGFDVHFEAHVLRSTPSFSYIAQQLILPVLHV